MENVQTTLDSAVADNQLPFVVAQVARADEVVFSGGAGNAAPNSPAADTTLFRVFSMSKAVAGVAAMQLIERGQLTLDTPVNAILPEWDKLQVLEGFADGTPQMRAPKTTATLRHLLTHTSGLAYEFWDQDTQTFLETTGHPSILSGLKASLFYPLIADPGTRWAYGPSTDWLGQVIAAVSGQSIEAYCQSEIFDPLGMDKTCFEPDKFQSDLCALSIRGEDGAFAPFELDPPSQPEFYGMGQALYSTAPDYLRFLRMILNRGQLDGARLLSEGSVDVFLSDHMQGKTITPMTGTMPALAGDVTLPKGSTHGVGCAITPTSQPGLRAAGSQNWAGACNTHYWCDPSSGIAAVFMTQSLPFYDPQVLNALQTFERAVYRAFG